jgi:hypothetical protein
VLCLQGRYRICGDVHAGMRRIAAHPALVDDAQAMTAAC